MTPRTVPHAVFHTRRRNEALGGHNPYEWRDVTTDEIFGGRRVALFAVPGAFTPACSESHLPGYERVHDDLLAAGVEAVFCLSVNDAFVLGQWARSRDVSKVVMLPDGNGEFTRKMGMLVERTTHGMGLRSWRYSMVVDDRTIKKMFVEPGFTDNPPGVGLSVSDAETMLAWLKGA
jgi:peroxiredoxin